ncbi:MAG: hypothetical protein JWQ03_2412 [Variovorax sp.]|nr:hypothetical protein [Variovorax sp.]
MSRWRVPLGIAGAVAYAALSHWMMLFHADAPWAVVVLLGPLWLTAAGLGAGRFGAVGATVVALLGVGFLALVWRGEVGDASRLYVLQHVGINLLLCGWFGSTLRAGRLSLIGSFAQRVHPLTPDHVAYTWRVTRVWTAYFALMAAASLGVYALLPFSAWSLLSNLVSPVLIGALFIGEYLLRYRLHPEFERTTMIQAVKAFSMAWDAPAARR